MITYEEALQLILRNTKPLSIEEVDITQSVGMVLAEDIYSRIYMPAFNKSAMDGYAVKARDVRKIPVKLKCIGSIQAGESFSKRVKTGECVKIMTGSPVPRDTDSVVMIENTRQLGECIEIIRSVEKGKNVCMRGEDIKVGQKVLQKGTRLCFSHISLIATVGRCFVKVTRKPRVAILNTGEEIISPGQKLGKNKIYNSNGPQLSAFLSFDNIESSFLGIVRDEPCELETAITKGLQYDILLISGGVSMGDYDLVPSILNKLGVQRIFHKVKIKPGKPLFFGVKRKKIVFGIPGNPVSNFLMYLLFIHPALYKMMRYKDCNPYFSQGIVTKSFHKKTGRKHFIPVIISRRDTEYYLTPLSSHGSADVFTLSKADGFMLVEEMSIAEKNSIKSFITWKEI